MAEIITAVDTSRIEEVVRLVGALNGLTKFKLGLETAESMGPAVWQELNLPPYSVFVDHKWFDIPNTVVGALRGLLEHIQPALVNVHALGGPAMMRAAADVLKAESPGTRLLAVTVLTSMDDAGISDVLGWETKARDEVIRLACMAQEAGCDGVVCSGHELPFIKDACGPAFLAVVPGIRPAGAASNDQKRVMTPYEACKLGADYLVIGRPITGEPDPAVAARAILAEMNGVG